MEEIWGEKRRFNCIGTCLEKKCGDNKFINELIALFWSVGPNSWYFVPSDFLASGINPLRIRLAFELFKVLIRFFVYFVWFLGWFELLFV
jgi:hypothetical protein